MTSTNNPLPDNTVQQLLDLLSKDDAFRKDFAANPSKALETLGVDPQETVLCCDPVASLASKEEFQELRDKLAKQLQVNSPFRVVFCFEAGGPAKSLDDDA